MKIKLKVFIFCLLFLYSSFLFAKKKNTLFFNQDNFSGSTWQIDDFYRGDSKKPFICLIQDVHCHEQVQYIIFEILEEMKKNFSSSFKTVGVEGNSGEIDTSILKDMSDSALKEDLSKNLIKRGLMTGAEYFDVFYPGSVRLFGVEDVALYNENLEQIQKGRFEDKIVEEEISILKNKNKNSKKIFYGSEMFQFERFFLRGQLCLK